MFNHNSRHKRRSFVAELIVLLICFFLAASPVSSAKLRTRPRKTAPASDNSCRFDCPPHTPVVAPRSGHKPSSNGCGTGGFFVADDFGFDACCVKHDLCYDTCGSLRHECDKSFQRCMNNICKQQKASVRDRCSSQASLFALGGTAFGCDAFLTSQANACECIATADEL